MSFRSLCHVSTRTTRPEYLAGKWVEHKVINLKSPENPPNIILLPKDSRYQFKKVPRNWKNSFRTYQKLMWKWFTGKEEVPNKDDTVAWVLFWVTKWVWAVFATVSLAFVTKMTLNAVSNKIVQMGQNKQIPPIFCPTSISELIEKQQRFIDEVKAIGEVRCINLK